MYHLYLVAVLYKFIAYIFEQLHIYSWLYAFVTLSVKISHFVSTFGVMISVLACNA